MNHFILDGVNSLDHHIIMTAPPKVQIPERDMESISIPGRNGDLTIDNGRYKNVIVEYACAILDDPLEYKTVFSDLLNLSQSAKYRRLEDSYSPKFFRLGKIKAISPVELIGNEAGTFRITFDCQPQNYLKTGDQWTHIRPGSSIGFKNITKEIALPQIVIVGNGQGDGTVFVGPIKLEVRNLDEGDRIIIDCEAMEALIKKASGTVAPVGDCLTMDDFPTLGPGAYSARFTGGIEEVGIKPRWWTP